MLPWSSVSTRDADEPVSLPLLDGSATNLAEFVEEKVPSAREKFSYWQRYLVGNGHVETILASLEWPNHWTVWYGRRLFKWSDGSQISADYAVRKPLSEWDTSYAPMADLPRLPARTRYFTPEEIRGLDDPAETRPLVVSLHGMTGGSHENYVRATIEKFEGTDFECVVLNTRGCNRTPLTNPIPFNAAWTEDIRQYIAHVTSTQPKRKIYLVGYSLGASVLANYLGQEAEAVSPQIVGACLAGCPFDLNESQRALDGSFVSRNVYSRAMAMNLLRYVHNNRAAFEKSPRFRKIYENVKRAQKQHLIKTVCDIDDYLSGPILGFQSGSEYYRMCSSANRVRYICVPTLVLAALDDPVVSSDAVPWTDLRKNQYIQVVTTSGGGHLGWFTLNGGRWSSDAISQYFTALQENVDFGSRLPPAKPSRSWFVGDRFEPALALQECYGE